tara:strand:- start:30 stop:560 length:531 start_codon:yes stop_codon:yes gene_type:complete
MTSRLLVDKIEGKTTANTVEMPSGSIVQAVQFHRPGKLGSVPDNLPGTSSANVQLSSSSFVDVISKTITTKLANSQIYVTLSVVVYDGTTNVRAKTKVLRDSTQIDGDQYGAYAGQSTMASYQVFILDTPNASAGTTLTYKLQAARASGSSSGLSIAYGDSSGGSSASLTLMEIAQ